MGIGAVSRPAVFLDRDGVLVEEIFYPRKPASGRRRSAGRRAADSPAPRQLRAGSPRWAIRSCSSPIRPPTQGQDQPARALAGARAVSSRCWRPRRGSSSMALSIPTAIPRASCRISVAVARSQAGPLQPLRCRRAIRSRSLSVVVRRRPGQIWTAPRPPE